MLSADVGYMWKFHFDPDTGLPQGCGVFEKSSDPSFYGSQKEFGFNDCPEQDLLDEHGVPLSQVVVNYAEDDRLWMKDFVEAYIKMQQNGWTDNNGISALNPGPSNFWTHKCCILRGAKIRNNFLKTAQTVKLTYIAQ